MKESYGGYSPSQSELTRSHSRGYAGYMHESNSAETRGRTIYENPGILDQIRETEDSRRRNKESEDYVPQPETVQDLRPVLEVAEMLAQNIKDRNMYGSRAESAAKLGLTSGTEFSPRFFQKVKLQVEKGPLADMSQGDLLAQFINFSQANFAEDGVRLNQVEVEYANAQLAQILSLLVDKYGMDEAAIRGWGLTTLRKQAAILMSHEEAKSQRVKGLDVTAMAKGGGRGARPEYLTSYDVDSMQAVCELIAGSYGEKWGKGGDRSLLKEIGKYYTYGIDEKAKEDADGNLLQNEDGTFVTDSEIAIKPVYSVNQGNFMNWVITRIMWLHDDSPDDVHNFLGSIGVENPWKSIGLNTMVNQFNKYFKDKKVVDIEHPDYQPGGKNQSLSAIATRFNTAIDVGMTDKATSEFIETVRANKKFAFEQVQLTDADGKPKFAEDGKTPLTREQITGVIEDIIHTELVEEVKRTTWAGTTLRAKDISYRGAMGSDESLPKTIVEIYKDNNLTKGTWSNKSLWYWVCTMPSTFRTSIGNIENETIMDSYETHKGFVPDIKTVIERAIPNLSEREKFYKNFSESNKDTKMALLSDLARQEDAKVGAAIVSLYLSYYNLSDYDELENLYNSENKKSLLFKPSTMLKQRKELSLDEHSDDEEAILSTKKIFQMYGIRTEDTKDQSGKIIEEGYHTVVAKRLDQKKKDFEAELITLSRGQPLTSEQRNQINSLSLSVEELGEIADGLATTTNKSKNEFITYFNFFTKASPDKRNIRLVRGVLKAAASEHVGMKYKREVRDRDETLQEISDVSNELNFADMMAFAQARFTLAAARNDTVAAGYDAGSKVLNFLQYRFKQPINGGNLGNWYNLSVFRQTGRDLMTAITTTTPEKKEKESDPDHFKTPLHVFKEIHEASRLIDPKMDTRSAGTVKTARQLTFDEQAMGQTSVNHYNRSFQIFHSVIGSKELRMEKLVHHDPIKGVVIEPDVFGEAVQETFLKPLRYCFKTHAGLDYSEIVRKRVMFDAQNPMHIEARRNGSTIYGKSNGEIVVVRGNHVMFDEHDPEHVAAKAKGDVFNAPGEEIILEMPLAYSLFGAQIFDHKDFWVKEYEMEHGKPKLDSHGNKVIKNIQEHVIDVEQLNKDNRALIFKRVAIARIAADLASHRDPASPFARLDAITIDTIIEALEQIPGEIYMDESDMARTRVTKAFITHADVDALMDMGRVGFYKTFAEDSYRAFLHGVGGSIAEAGAATLKAIFS